MLDPIFFKSNCSTSVVSGQAKRIITNYNEKVKQNDEKAIRDALKAQICVDNADAESEDYEPMLRHSQLDPYNFEN